MKLTCPHCGFSKELPQSLLPEGAKQATCPKCRRNFPLQPEAQENPQLEAITIAPPRPAVDRSKEATQSDLIPKAGFWLRVVATLIDAFIVFVLQFSLGALLAFAGVISSAASGETAGTMAIVVQLFGFVLSCAYYVVFTGHCGQTPGKMALRIKVIRCDGSDLSYGRAAFREIPAKFISGIILCIGYLMVAFDDQKQGLHDRMADTYVIKL